MFNDIDWLKNKIAYFKTDEIDSVLLFAFFWNLFEREIAECNAEINKSSRYISQLVNDSKYDEALETIWEFMKCRYVNDEMVTEKFNYFDFKPNDNKAFVQKTLLKSEPTKADKCESILRIIFRLRNNLLHGVKDINQINEQNELFMNSNQFLSIILDLNSHK